MKPYFSGGAAPMRKSFVLCAILICPSASLAGDGPFAGLLLGVDVGVSSNLSTADAKYDYTNLFGAAADAADSAKKHSNGDLERIGTIKFNLGYGIDLGDSFNIVLGGALYRDGQDRKVDSGTYGFPNPNSRADYPKEYSVETAIDPNAHASLSLQPGYKFSDDFLGFVSVAYHYMQADVYTTTSIDRSNINAAASVSDVSTSKTFHGVGVGFGGKYALTENWYINASADWIYFGPKKIAGPNVTSTPDEITLNQLMKIEPSWASFRIGVGYSF